jgi:hypothetical protein
VTIDTLIGHNNPSVQIIGYRIRAILTQTDPVNSKDCDDLAGSILEAVDSAYKQGYEEAAYNYGG